MTWVAVGKFPLTSGAIAVCVASGLAGTQNPNSTTRRTIMTIELPKAIAAYFAADKRNNAADVSECFVETAFVKDEGHTYLGRDEIRDWKNSSSKKYDYTVEAFNITTDGRRTVVTSHLTGNFPGSPVDLRYLFVIDGEKIQELEITI